jgi:hypothetical protein
MRLKLLAYRDDTVESPLMAGVNVAGGTLQQPPGARVGQSTVGLKFRPRGRVRAAT